MYNTWWYGVFHAIISLVSGISWTKLRAVLNSGKSYDLTEPELDTIRSLLKPSYYIILTYRKTHLSTYLIGLASLLKTGKWPSYIHVLMNVDDGNIASDTDFKLVEATGKGGVHYSTFMEVFNCDRVCLMRPKGYTDDDWTASLDGLLSTVGKQYDDLFSLNDDTRMSCVEDVRYALMKSPDYAKTFADFEELITKKKNLVPQMFRDCKDFEVAYETPKR
jgi:hypothetical protein